LALSNPTLPEITDGYEIQLHHSMGHDRPSVRTQDWNDLLIRSPIFIGFCRRCCLDVKIQLRREALPVALIEPSDLPSIASGMLGRVEKDDQRWPSFIGKCEILLNFISGSESVKR